jgi:hypothetical protein
MLAASAQVRVWFFTLTEFILVQALVQVLAAVTGLITVRWLAKGDYALYTIANTWLAALVLLSNSGIGSAATALGGKVWQDRRQLGGVIASALRMRRWLASVTVLPVMAVLIWTLVENGAGRGMVLAMTALVAIGATIQLTNGILIVVLRLRGQVRRMQAVDSVGGLSRLALTAAAIPICFNSVLALAISVAGGLVQSVMIRKAVADGVDLAAPPDPEVTRRIRAVIGRQWPNEVNGVFQGQISIILLSFFGTVASVADLGALGRIAILFTIFTATIQAVVLPRYARCQDPARLRTLYVGIVAGYAAAAMMPVLLTWLLPQPFLWLLGPQYAQLSYELMLVALNAGLASINGATWGLNTSRAWIIPGWGLVPAGLAIQFSLMLMVGVSTVEEVLLIGILSSVAGIVINIVATVVFSRGFSRA